MEGGGVNATVTQTNIAATNGFVHIIDRVLGIPYTTVFEKMKTDPMLKWENFIITLNYNLLKKYYQTKLKPSFHTDTESCVNKNYKTVSIFEIKCTQTDCWFEFKHYLQHGQATDV